MKRVSVVRGPVFPNRNVFSQGSVSAAGHVRKDTIKGNRFRLSVGKLDRDSRELLSFVVGDEQARGVDTLDLTNHDLGTLVVGVVSDQKAARWNEKRLLINPSSFLYKVQRPTNGGLPVLEELCELGRLASRSRTHVEHPMTRLNVQKERRNHTDGFLSANVAL